MAIAPLFYNTKPDEYTRHYGEKKLFSGDNRQIETQLTTSVAAIQIIAILAATVFTAWIIPPFSWPVILLGTAGIISTIYNNFLTKDPLVETFHQIVGGKDKFEQLPIIELDTTPPHDSVRVNGTLADAVRKLRFHEINHRISRATFGGRNVVVVKAITRDPEVTSVTAQAKSIFVFVEKPTGGDTYIGSESGGSTRNGVQERVYNYKIETRSSITTSMANEFFAQLN